MTQNLWYWSLNIIHPLIDINVAYSRMIDINVKYSLPGSLVYSEKCTRIKCTSFIFLHGYIKIILHISSVYFFGGLCKQLSITSLIMKKSTMMFQIISVTLGLIAIALCQPPSYSAQYAKIRYQPQTRMANLKKSELNLDETSKEDGKKLIIIKFVLVVEIPYILIE